MAASSFGASFGTWAKGGGKGGKVGSGFPTDPPPPPGVQQRATRKGFHPDAHACPSILARQDTTYAATPGSKRRWKVNGQFPCSGATHFARRHRQQWVLENPNKPIPTANKGKGKGKGKLKGKTDPEAHCCPCRWQLG